MILPCGIIIPDVWGIYELQVIRDANGTYPHSLTTELTPKHLDDPVIDRDLVGFLSLAILRVTCGVIFGILSASLCASSACLCDLSG